MAASDRAQPLSEQRASRSPAPRIRQAPAVSELIRPASVLDLDCKAHDLDNLYIADASFFPSIGRGGTSTLDDHRQCTPGGRPYQGALGRVKVPRTMLLAASGGLAAGREYMPRRYVGSWRSGSCGSSAGWFRTWTGQRRICTGRLWDSVPSPEDDADGATLAALGGGGAAAEEVVMRLGAREIALVRLAAPSRPLPAGQPQQRSMVPASGDRGRVT